MSTAADLPAARVELALSGSNVTGDVPFSCALRLAGQVHGARPAAGVRGDLTALVASLCAEHGVAPAAVTDVRVDVGPGSYTGLRVAVTFVRFLQHFGGVRVHACDSLALLAARARDARGRVHAVLDARRGRFHVQPFTVRDGAVAATAPAAAVPLPNVLAGIGAGDVVVRPAALAPALAAEVLARGAILRGEQELLAAEMFAVGLPFADAEAEDLEPRYLMASYAEDQPAAAAATSAAPPSA